jgi:hypothetical protein
MSMIEAQQKTIVLTRKVEKQFPLNKDPRIFINTERGMINIKSWDQSSVKIVVKLIAKNTDFELAREELNLMNYSLTETRNSVFVSNRMQLSKLGEAISSVIRAEYEIYVPRNIEIHLDNRFGNVRMENVAGGIYGELYYSDISLEKYSGDINLHISTGDFTCSKSILNGMLYTRHSDVSISETGGKLRLEAEYGKVELTFGKLKLTPTLVTQASDITIVNKVCFPLELILYGKYCPLEFDKDCYASKADYLNTSYLNNEEGKLWKFFYKPPDKATRLNINANFGSINLR